MKIFLTFFILLSTLYGEKILKIANYNVENLFDLYRSGYEYQEYIPNTKSQWNKKNYTIKLKNLSKVIKEIDADIIALEEIESLEALKDLRKQLKYNGLYYRYYAIANKKNTTVKVAILSKIPIFYTRELSVTSSYKYRNILEVKFKVNNKDIYLFVNHWKSKGGPESMRIISAKALLRRIKQIGFEKNIILLGDFNSDYQEYIKFKRKRKHNDTNGKTGINHVLNTIKQTAYAHNVNYTSKGFYNLWYDVKKDTRYCYIYKGKKETLDNILISQPLLFGTQGVQYQKGSMHSVKFNYLFKSKRIYRWQTTRKKPRKHRGKGYSDHLPIVANFIIKE